MNLFVVLLLFCLAIPGFCFKRTLTTITTTERQKLCRKTPLFASKDSPKASKNDNLVVSKSASMKDGRKSVSQDADEKPSILEQVASKGLAGVLAIAVAEAIFWALGLPLAELYYRYTTGEWIDLASTDGQLKAAGFSFGYGGFATVILQYRVTLFAIPLVPIMEKFVVQPGKKIFGDAFGEKS